MIAFGSATESNPLVADAEFFSLIDWDPAAPKALVRAAESGDWQRAIRLLVAGSRAQKFARTAPAGGDDKPALWSLEQLEHPQRLQLLAVAWRDFNPFLHLASSTRKQSNGHMPRQASARRPSDSAGDLAQAIADWLDSASETSAVLSLERLIVLEILRDAGSRLPIDLAARLWRAALDLSINQFRAPASVTSDLPVAALEAELAWQAGLFFAPVAGAADLPDAGRSGLWQVLCDCSDSAGIPAAKTLSHLPDCVASIVRARDWGHRLGRSLFNASQEKRFRGLLDAIAKMCRQDGRLALCSRNANGHARVWSTAAFAFHHGRHQASPSADYLKSLGSDQTPHRRPGHAERNGTRRNGHLTRKVTRPVFQSDESRLACLRNDWSKAANSVIVSHHAGCPAIEMALRGATLVSGKWDFDLTLDGRAVELADWKCACWHSDADGDYAELQAQGGRVRIERQVFLSRTDEFALLGDVVVADGPAKIETISRLGLSSDWAAITQTRTRECRFLSSGTAVRALPVGLNCPRVEGTAGRLSAAGGHLELRQSGVGGLYAPLVFDWNPTRRRSPAGWRRLTVALAGAAVPASEASGFLLEVGSSKWLIYRSLRPTLEPRSVLGQHTMYETMFGRFVKGDLEPFVQVEQTSEKSE